MIIKNVNVTDTYDIHTKISNKHFDIVIEIDDSQNGVIDLRPKFKHPHQNHNKYNSNNNLQYHHNLNKYYSNNNLQNQQYHNNVLTPKKMIKKVKNKYGE